MWETMFGRLLVAHIDQQSLAMASKLTYPSLIAVDDVHIHFKSDKVNRQLMGGISQSFNMLVRYIKVSDVQL